MFESTVFGCIKFKRGKTNLQCSSACLACGTSIIKYVAFVRQESCQALLKEDLAGKIFTKGTTSKKQ